MSWPLKLAAGIFVTALSALPQYTISARPGIINSIEGIAYVNGTKVNDAKAAQRMFLNANDTLATDNGKAEVLLTPGVYLRMGDHSEVRMISPSLTNTQLAVTKGTAMVEAMELLKENNVQVHVGGAVTQLDKVGLYRFSAGDPAKVAVFEGKASIDEGGKKIDVGKEHELALNGTSKTQKFKAKDEQGDDLYAWTKTRDEYDSASSYSASKTLASSVYSGGGGWGGYGFSGFNGFAGPGWFYNPVFGSYAWLPGDGAFFSPFGYGFYSPGYVMYAPVVLSNLNGVRSGGGVAVPVNVNHVPTVGTTSGHRPPILVPANRTGGPMLAGVGASGGHLSGNTMTRSAAAPGGGAASAHGGGYSGGGASAASRGMSAGSMSAGHSGGASAGGGHR